MDADRQVEQQQIPRFEACLAFVLEREGGYVDDPQDHGGATNQGVTQRVYDQFRDLHTMARQPVRNITADEVRLVYRVLYWQSVCADELPPPLDFVMFDSAVQHGASGATRLLQRALQIPEDGVFGPGTLQAALNHMAELVMAERQAYYAKIIRNDPSQQKFANGWRNRMAELETAAGIA